MAFEIDKDTQNTLMRAGINNLGSALAGQGNQQYAQFNAANNRLDAAKSREQTALQNALAQKGNAFAMKQAQQDTGDDAAARMMGNSPLQFQNERAKAARTQEMFKQIDGGALKHLGVHAGPFAGGTNYATNFGPSAEAEQPYWDTVARISRGRAASPNLGAIYGKPGEAVDATVKESGDARWNEWAGQWDANQQEQNAGFNELRTLAAKDAEQAKAEADKAAKTTAWQKFMQVLGVVGPIAASAFLPKLPGGGGAAGNPNSAGASFGSGSADMLDFGSNNFAFGPSSLTPNVSTSEVYNTDLLGGDPGYNNGWLNALLQSQARR